MEKAAERQLKISQLTALVAVAEQGSFSAAALQLGLAQSTVSHAIATLETDLGIVLLLRGRSGAVLTPLGLQICQQAKSVLALLADIRQTAQQAKELQTGRVRVATVRSVATHILPGVISRFRQRHPSLTVDIAEYDRYAEVEETLHAGQADVGITLLPTASDFQSWELFRDDFVALLPPAKAANEKVTNKKAANEAAANEADNQDGVPIQGGEPMSWEQLLSYPRIVNQRSIGHNSLVEAHLAKFGHRLPIDYAVREDSTLMGLVAKGLGVAVISRLEAEPIPTGVRVKSLPEPLERSLGVAILDSAVLPRAVFVFLDVLLAVPLL